MQAEYAKAGPDDILIRLTISNCGPETADLRILPTFWFRNTWTWGCDHEGCWPKPAIYETDGQIVASHVSMSSFQLSADKANSGEAPEWRFTENETNPSLHPNVPTSGRRFKDAFHRLVIDGDQDAISQERRGTKVAADYSLTIPAGESRTIKLRMSAIDDVPSECFSLSLIHI